MSARKYPTQKNKNDTGPPKGFWFRSTLALLMLYSLYIIIGRTINTGNLPISLNPVILLDPSGTSLLIILFGILYFSAVISKKIAIPTFTKISGYIIATVTVLAVVMSFFFEGRNHSSSDDFYFIFTVLFHNPFISGLISVTAIVGSIDLLIRLIKTKKKR